MIQTDVMMFRPIPETLLCFDFIGAVYLNPNERTPDGRGFNGGFNLRRRSVVLDCLNKVRIEDVQAYRKERGCKPLPSLEYFGTIAEDVFMMHALEMCGAKFPTDEEACRFSTEAVYTRDSVGIHGFQWIFFPFDDLVEMVQTNRELSKYM